MQKISASFPNKKVLIVDDYAVNLEILSEMLELMQCEVKMAESGNQALEHLQNENFDMILMDVQMPGMDGYACTKAIREMDGEEPHTIIAITANAMNGDKQTCLDAGMDDYLSKPIKGYELEALLQRFLG